MGIPSLFHGSLKTSQVSDNAWKTSAIARQQQSIARLLIILILVDYPRMILVDYLHHAS